MTDREFVAAVAKGSALTIAQVRKVLRSVERVALEQLAKSPEVRVPHLVRLQRHQRPERVVRNPSTGDRWLMGEMTILKAKPVKGLSDKVKALN